MSLLVGLGRVAILFVVGLLIALPGVLVSASAAEAAGRSVDPREIALGPADLPAGFIVDTGTTGLTTLPDGLGVVYRVDMKRQPSPENAGDGPIIVQQMIMRVDASTSAVEMLAAVRDEIVSEAGLTMTADGPNDGGTVSLKRQDGDVSLNSVGFAKDQLVIFTTTGGLSTVTTFAGLVELAGITSSRLDAALSR